MMEKIFDVVGVRSGSDSSCGGSFTPGYGPGNTDVYLTLREFREPEKPIPEPEPPVTTVATGEDPPELEKVGPVERITTALMKQIENNKDLDEDEKRVTKKMARAHAQNSLYIIASLTGQTVEELAAEGEAMRQGRQGRNSIRGRRMSSDIVMATPSGYYTLQVMAVTMSQAAYNEAGRPWVGSRFKVSFEPFPGAPNVEPPRAMPTW